MVKLRLLLTAIVASMICTSFAVAVDTPVYSVQGPQDPLWINTYVHEVGEYNVFPLGERIVSSWQYTSLTSCFDGSDNPQLPNILVTAMRIEDPGFQPFDGQLKSYRIWYVADAGTTISNFDGWIGNLGLNDAQQAFRINNYGINRPLVSESVANNNLWDPNETISFILQDFQNINGGPAAPFDSIGIAGLSGGWPPSTGSLLVPEPATLGLLVLGGLAVLRRWR